ncbi:hypothetical protein [Glycomyces arizonensis]|uniref:hypothetical protein n=1 Tax=Glycomyces arizonensis TaxID=256035 RepID=UPI000421BA83|nr:hypothetical protein [Glycomyces arizonensis]
MTESGSADNAAQKKRLTASHVINGILAIALLGATATAWYFAAQARTPAQRAEETAEPADSVITVQVEQGQLSDLMEFEAVLDRVGGYEVPAPASIEGADIALTSDIPLETGDEVKTATVLLEVSGRPMIALPGEVPAYRNLVEGDTGPDVEQLQQALQGLYGTPVTGEFDSRTADDIEKLYANLGYEAPTTSETTVEPTGEDESAEGADDGTEAVGGAQVQTVDRVMFPASEAVFLPQLPMQVGKIDATQGAPVEGMVMTLVSGDWKLEAELSEEEAAALSQAGDEAELEYGPGPLEGMEASVPDLETREVEAQGEEGTLTVEKTFAVFAFDAADLDDGEELVPGIGQELVLVRARSAEDALIVPLSAVWTDSQGRTMVTVLEGETERRVEVEIAIRHDGRGVVEPVGGELAAGEEVVVAWHDQTGA